MKVIAAFFEMPATIAARNYSSINMRDAANQIESMEWAPQGLIVKAKKPGGGTGTYIVGHSNIRSAEIEEAEAIPDAPKGRAGPAAEAEIAAMLEAGRVKGSRKAKAEG